MDECQVERAVGSLCLRIKPRSDNITSSKPNVEVEHNMLNKRHLSWNVVIQKEMIYLDNDSSSSFTQFQIMFASTDSEREHP